LQPVDLLSADNLFPICIRSGRPSAGFVISFRRSAFLIREIFPVPE